MRGRARERRNGFSDIYNPHSFREANADAVKMLENMVCPSDRSGTIPFAKPPHGPLRSLIVVLEARRSVIWGAAKAILHQMHPLTGKVTIYPSFVSLGISFSVQLYFYLFRTQEALFRHHQHHGSGSSGILRDFKAGSHSPFQSGLQF